MPRIRQSDGASKGHPRTPLDEYMQRSSVGSPVLNEAQLIQRKFKLTATQAPAQIGKTWQSILVSPRRLSRIKKAPAGAFRKWIGIDTTSNHFYWSDDLVTWAQGGYLGNSAAAGAFQSELSSGWAFGNGLFVAVSGDNNYPKFALNSVTGANDGVFSTILRPDSYKAWINTIAYGNGIWMACGDNTINRSGQATDKTFFTSSDNGATWTPLAHTRNDYWSPYDLIFKDGSWFVRMNGKKYRSDDNGATWVQTSVNDAERVRYSAATGKFYALKYGTFYSSPDFVTWTAHTPPTSQASDFVVLDNGAIVFRAYVSGQMRFYYSEDLTSWTYVASPINSNATYTHMDYGDNKIVTCIYGNTSLLISP